MSKNRSPGHMYVLFCAVFWGSYLTYIQVSIEIRESKQAFFKDKKIEKWRNSQFFPMSDPRID